MGVATLKNIKFKARLTISEPWEQSTSLTGILEKNDKLGIPGLLFTADDNRMYILRLRFKSTQINDLWNGKYVIVNIEEYLSTSLNLPSPKSKSPFIGIGSIEIIESSKEYKY
jgi:hypothetical protein